MDFMPGKGEHETCIFATFTGKAVRRHGITFMSTCVTHQYKQIQNGGTETM